MQEFVRDSRSFGTGAAGTALGTVWDGVKEQHRAQPVVVGCFCADVACRPMQSTFPEVE